jgi:GntR family transcriptional repressor for pyruvate dehydrogenase complex
MVRTSDSEKMERLILAALNNSQQPIGAPQILNVLIEHGVQTSEATVGRFLRNLDRQNLTVLFGKRGRLLSDRGRARLEHLEILERISSHNVEVAKIINPTDLDALLELLHVRRALEPEAARLSALRASVEERSALLALAREQMEDVEHGESAGGDAALRFHRLIAQASHNSLLISVASLVLDTTNDPLADVLDEVAKRTGSLQEFAHDHQHLYEAIAARDAETAEREMRSHIDDLIRRVERYRILLLEDASKLVVDTRR